MGVFYACSTWEDGMDKELFSWEVENYSGAYLASHVQSSLTSQKVSED